MKKDIDINICIRINRDAKQIAWCKRRVNEMDPSVVDLSQSLSLAANEVRLKILLLLKEEVRLCVCDLAEILGMKLPAVSQHLRKLKDGGLVFTEREGTTIFYHLTSKVQPLLNALISIIPAQIV
jgi:DNA-binding transcriptional ArsR family regulator